MLYIVLIFILGVLIGRISMRRLKYKFSFNKEKTERCPICNGRKGYVHYKPSVNKEGIYLDRLFYCNKCNVEINNDTIFITLYSLTW